MHTWCTVLYHDGLVPHGQRARVAGGGHRRGRVPSGQTTGWRCGTILGKNELVTYPEGTVNGMTRSASANYSPGDVVAHNGLRWEATFWSSNTGPGDPRSWAVWEDAGTC